jgi:hypothetical protein
MQQSPIRPKASDDYRASERYFSKAPVANPLPEPPRDEPNQLSFTTIWGDAR